MTASSRSSSSATSIFCTSIAISCSSRSGVDLGAERGEPLRQLRAYARLHFRQARAARRRRSAKPATARELSISAMRSPSPARDAVNATSVSASSSWATAASGRPRARSRARRPASAAGPPHRCAPAPPSRRCTASACSITRSSSASSIFEFPAGDGERAQVAGGLDLAAARGRADGAAQVALDRAQLLRQPQADLEIAVIDAPELPGEQSQRSSRARCVRSLSCS